LKNNKDFFSLIDNLIWTCLMPMSGKQNTNRPSCILLDEKCKRCGASDVKTARLQQQSYQLVSNCTMTIIATSCTFVTSSAQADFYAIPMLGG
jgi:hypothetical protein